MPNVITMLNLFVTTTKTQCFDFGFQTQTDAVIILSQKWKEKFPYDSQGKRFIQAFNFSISHMVSPH